MRRSSDGSSRSDSNFEAEASSFSPGRSGARWTSWLITLLGLIALGYLFRSGAWEEVRDGVARLQALDAGVGFLLYLLFVGIKALRYRVLLGNLPWKVLLRAVGLHTFWSNLLPFRTGDVAYLLLLRREGAVALRHGTSALLLASLLDLWWVASVTGGAGLLLLSRGAGHRGTIGTLSGWAAGISLVGALLFLFSRQAIEAIGRRLAAAKAAPDRLRERLMDLNQYLSERIAPRRLGMLLLLSGFLLGLRYGFQLYLVVRMFPEVSAGAALFALAFTSWVNLFPVQGVANLGSVEIPWAWAMAQAGVSGPTGLTSGFALHGVVLTYALGIGALSELLPRRS
ncbi:MAG: hypothetical protein KatS3mg115_1789 [Candidatus Poribacteria bacterium]|nr:MAG: hypothetical protein KatS3mg115_1789 [Candidatus Poribacteria bacterium]